MNDDLRRALRRRLTLTAFEADHVFLAPPALALLILAIVGWALVPVTVGLLLVLVALPGAQLLADHHRARAATVLGEPIIAEYRWTGGKGPLGRAWIWVRDPARWRDLLFLAFASTVGFAMSVLAVSLLVSPVAHVVLALVLGQAWWWAAAVAGPPLWWVLVPPLARARARVTRSLLAAPETAALRRRVAEVSASRADAVDHSAAELRRIERDLHDGAQARIVSLGMTLGLAEEVLAADPDGAAELLREARQTSVAALADLRDVVHGIHPPVLADRGLVGAVRALAEQLALPVTVSGDLDGRPPEPVESAVYFAVAECLANAAKHSGARSARVALAHAGGLLTADVLDDGRGGARREAGSGLRGIERRLAAFDGTLRLTSPPGGPTAVHLEVPCALSSPRISPSSGTA